VWVDESVEVIDLCDPALCGTVWIRLELTVADARTSTDKLILRTADGYKQQHVIASDRIAADDAGEAIDIEFTDTPVNGVFTLTIVPGDGEAYDLFTDVPFTALGVVGVAPANADNDNATDGSPPPEAIAGIDQPAADALAYEVGGIPTGVSLVSEYRPDPHRRSRHQRSGNLRQPSFRARRS
jgi:hypothetical protein